jgi:hypothetical protein
MARPTIQSNNWKFHVVQEQWTRNNKQTGFFGNFRTDTGECLGVTTEKYGIIQNEELYNTAIAALETKGMKDFEEKIVVSGNGERFYAEFAFKNKQLASAVGDMFGYKLVLQNSFDRTKRAAFSLGFLRLACLNGMATMEKEFNATSKHSSKVSAAFIADAIDKALARGQSALGVYDMLANTAIADEQGQTILANLERGNLLSGVLREAIETLWLAPKRAEDKARNLYNLYNAVTEHLTHQVAAERYEYAGKVSNNVLFTFLNAARNQDKLSRLLIPVPKDETVKVEVNPTPIIAAAGTDILEVEVVQ